MSKILLVSRCAWTLYNFRRGQIKALLNDGHEVIGGGSGGDGFEDKVRSLGSPFITLPIDRRALNPISDLQLLRTMIRWYRKEKPDIVHHFTIKPVIYGSLAAKIARVPRIVNTVTGLGYVFSDQASSLLRRVVELQYRTALANTHFTFFQNEEDRGLFVSHKLVPINRSGLLKGSGVDTKYFAPQAAAPQGTADCVTFLMVARILRDKGVYEYVEAARQVRARYPNTRFLLLGARDERNPMVVSQDDISAWQAEGAVQWLGETQDVRTVVQDADVVVLPSYREGTPRSLLEAASMGKPLITTSAVGCREAVDDEVTGLVVPIKDPAGLARAMLRLRNDPEARTSMGMAGRAKMEREFDEEMVIAQIREIYSKELS